MCPMGSPSPIALALPLAKIFSISDHVSPMLGASLANSMDSSNLEQNQVECLMNITTENTHSELVANVSDTMQRFRAIL